MKMDPHSTLPVQANQEHCQRCLQTLPALPGGTSRQQPDNEASPDRDQLQLGSLVVLGKQGGVKGYSRSHVKLVFAPEAQGQVRERVVVIFRSGPHLPCSTNLLPKTGSQIQSKSSPMNFLSLTVQCLDCRRQEDKSRGKPLWWGTP